MSPPPADLDTLRRLLAETAWRGPYTLDAIECQGGRAVLILDRDGQHMRDHAELICALLNAAPGLIEVAQSARQTELAL